MFKAPFVFKNCLSFVLSRFYAKEHTFRLRNGLKYVVTFPGDRYVISEIFILKPYTRGGFRINKDDIILDVGAHIGAFALYAADIAYKGKLYALEPVAGSFKSLCNNIAINGFKNIIPFNIALDASEGTKKIYLSRNAWNASSFIWDRNPGSHELVKTATLAGFLEQNEIKTVNFLKMDCEGAEFDILLNTGRETLNKIQRIAMEYHNISTEKNAGTLREYLEERGFKVKTTQSKWNGMLYAEKRKRQEVAYTGAV